MCGIVGLYLKNPELRSGLGTLFSPMLAQMRDRGPDSAGIAVYRDAAASDAKVVVYHPETPYGWDAVAGELADRLGCPVTAEPVANHAILTGGSSATALRDAVFASCPGVRVMSAGTSLEIYKDVGLPAEVLDRFRVSAMSGSHAIGHTRMATESAVSTEGAHPFNTGEDLCLVHNGSLSNHNGLREWLSTHKGIPFQTDNDSEVAAAYLTWRMSEGATLSEALEAALSDLDGFYTFAIGTRDGFAVLRDPVACKPAVMAETDDWVAMASEFRALAALPGIEAATVWEPKPATVYSWGRA
ncbi:class II glutamine amidotransferase [Amorphus orientalis]|uniref:Glutamate synthase domain-containing protein 1 n=1 Tax=Amorphus orientalis TaxID=649198 RepID=A0AAE4AUU6_9HYPH|nr:glutamine amidotransferase family protein [Amorphus orientalis]MDQ0316109.1 glutamate synthase domain-containing protein 1 [Amorphus orientalis]